MGRVPGKAKIGTFLLICLTVGLLYFIHQRSNSWFTLSFFILKMVNSNLFNFDVVKKVLALVLLYCLCLEMANSNLSDLFLTETCQL